MVGERLYVAAPRLGDPEGLGVLWLCVEATDGDRVALARYPVTEEAHRRRGPDRDRAVAYQARRVHAGAIDALPIMHAYPRGEWRTLCGLRAVAQDGRSGDGFRWRTCTACEHEAFARTAGRADGMRNDG